MDEHQVAPAEAKEHEWWCPGNVEHASLHSLRDLLEGMFNDRQNSGDLVILLNDGECEFAHRCAGGRAAFVVTPPASCSPPGCTHRRSDRASWPVFCSQ